MVEEKTPEARMRAMRGTFILKWPSGRRRSESMGAGE